MTHESFFRDTVSSVRLSYSPSMRDPQTTLLDVGCIRHALSLDERRVRYLPEYNMIYSRSHDVKEVWFVGSHSDVSVSIILSWFVHSINDFLSLSAAVVILPRAQNKKGPAQTCSAALLCAGCSKRLMRMVFRSRFPGTMSDHHPRTSLH